jgi:MscS family membrane protein
MEQFLMSHLFVAVLIIMAFWPAAAIIRAILKFVAERVVTQTETDLDDKIVSLLLRTVTPVVATAAFGLALREVSKGLTASELTAHQLVEYGQQLVYVVLVLLALKVIVGIARELIEWSMDQATRGEEISLKSTLGPMVRKTVNVVAALVAAIIVLDHFGINIGSLLVSLGVGSLAVALAAQDTLANVFAGFVILVDRPFRVGDRIEIASGQSGDVVQIGLRSTRFVNFDNNVVILPNAELVKSRIVNVAHPNAPTRVLLRFDIAYGADPAKVRSVLLELAGANPDLLKDPIPQVVLAGMADGALQFQLIARSQSYQVQFRAETAMREQAYIAFREAGIDLAVPVRRVTTVQEKG